ncbi:MAG: EAL domain-containing protein [Alphaproteobacteria bacterium]
MERIGGRRIAYGLVGIIAIALMVVASIHVAREQVLDRYRVRADRLAADILQRAEATRTNLHKVFAALDAVSAMPCSEGGVTLMRRIAIDLRLAGAGYADSGRLRCSSWGVHDEGLDLGPRDYRSAEEIDVRIGRELPIAPGTKLLIVTNPKGWTALVNAGSAIAIAEDDPTLTLAVIARSSGRTLVARGDPDPDWPAEVARSDHDAEIHVRSDRVVAWRRSAKLDFAAYAAVPTAEVSREANRLALLLTPIGLVAGCAVALAGFSIAQRNTSMQALLRAGLRRNEVMVHYQPIVDLATGGWVGAEALLRWRRPGGEWVAPSIFVPIAEKYELMQQLTMRAMKVAIADMAPTLRQRPGYFVSLNMTASDLRDPAIRETLDALVAGHGVQPSSIHIELTEREILDADDARRAIADIREAGYRVAVDDFGVGYSNLSYLESLQLDYLKIDRVFLHGADGSETRKQTISHIIEMAQERGIKVIAEGIETTAQLEFLRARRVDLGQGWLFSDALPIEDLERRQLAQESGKRG